jgi:hypothetical protein
MISAAWLKWHDVNIKITTSRRLFFILRVLPQAPLPARHLAYNFENREFFIRC